jgi:hypothetical protein
MIHIAKPPAIGTLVKRDGSPRLYRVTYRDSNSCIVEAVDGAEEPPKRLDVWTGYDDVKHWSEKGWDKWREAEGGDGDGKAGG